MLVAKGFSGDDPQGLTTRARELAGEYNGNGASSLGGSLRALTDAFGKLFNTITNEGPDGTSALEDFAKAVERIAKAFDTLAENWGKVTKIGRFIQNPFNLNIPEAGFTPRPNSNAAGGSVMRNEITRVGEFGPELFVPQGVSGSIRRDNGGSGVTIIMNGVIDGESARRSIERLLQDSSRRTGAVNLVGSAL
jgi:hypothetical protein